MADPNEKSPSPSSSPQSDSKSWYSGSCHCQAVRFRALLRPLTGADPAVVNSCNCSICQRNGYLFVYPTPEEVDIQSGFDEVTRYRFSKGAIEHVFCGVCGSSVWEMFLSDSGEAETFGINVSKEIIYQDYSHIV